MRPLHTPTHRLYDAAVGCVILRLHVCVARYIPQMHRAGKRAVAPIQQRCKKGDVEESDGWLKGMMG